MTKILIVYGSTTGNTETVSQKIEALLAKDYDVVLQNVSETKPRNLAENYDVLLFGSSTWGADDIEFQQDFSDFFEDFNLIGINGKKVAAFGCGDSSFEYFCGAVDAIEEKTKDLGGNVIVSGLKIDGDPEDFENEIQDWVKQLKSKLS
ncbi:MAG: flavodoxin [Alphaproteobacteria bacterium]